MASKAAHKKAPPKSRDDGDEKDRDEDGDKPWEKAKKRDSKKSDNRDDDAKNPDEDDTWEKADDDDDDDEDMDKSEGITPASLAKSLRAISAYVSDNDRGDRRQALLSKAQRTELSKAETHELYGILGGQAPEQDEGLSDRMAKSMDDNHDVAQTVDISDYVAGLHQELNKSLRAAGEAIESIDERQHNFNLLNARVSYQMGGLLKSIDARLAAIEGTPARAPKSQGAAPRALEKSFSGSQPQGEQLSKSQVLDVLDDMVASSHAEGRAGLSKSGEDLVRSVAKYEQLSQLSPSLADEVRDYHRNRRAG